MGGVFELLHDYVLLEQSRRLPELADHVVYIALAPFMGAEGRLAGDRRRGEEDEANRRRGWTERSNIRKNRRA